MSNRHADAPNPPTKKFARFSFSFVTPESKALQRRAQRMRARAAKRIGPLGRFGLKTSTS